MESKKSMSSGIPDKSALTPHPISSVHTVSSVLIQALVDIVGSTKNKYPFEKTPTFSGHICVSRWH